MPDINLTRMELIKTKERVVLARKGHKLLKQKRDALILEFFRILKKARDIRSELLGELQAAYRAANVATLYHSGHELHYIALGRQRKIEMDMEVKNVMGVKIPSMASVQEEAAIALPEFGTSAKIDEATTRFEKVLQLVLQLAETETAIRRLILEIEKTKRRVNALEYIVIPNLEAQRNTIAFRLDEMERDNLVSLKSIKRKLELGT